MAEQYNIQSLEGAPVAAKQDYSAYVDYVENILGGRREQITIDENYTKIVTLSSVAAGGSGTFIDIRCPAGQKFSIMGTQQIVRGADARTAHALRMRLANSIDTEIGLFNKIRATKEGITDSVTNLWRVFYADVNLAKNAAVNADLKTDLEWYRYKQGVELNGEQHLIFAAILLGAADSIDGVVAHLKFAQDVDVWYF